MRTLKDVEAYLDKLNRRHEASEQQGTYLLHSSESMPPIALRVDPPLVVLRVHIGDAPAPPASATAGGARVPEHAALFRKLLEHNAKDLVHASYGLEGDRIVLVAALELENLDFNEIEATLDEIDVALAQQVPGLVELCKAKN